MCKIKPIYNKINKFLFLILLFTIVSCSNNNVEEIKVEKEPLADLMHIKARGVLKVLIDYSSTDYFIYKGNPMGFHYELLQHLADNLGVKLELTVNNNIEECIELLQNGKYDLLAKNLTITNERKNKLNFIIPHSKTKQVLVQRTKSKNKSKYVSSLSDIVGKKVYVQSGTAFIPRLKNLSNEIGKDINVRTIKGKSEEELIALLSQGKIDYTIADAHVAKVNSFIYKNIDYSLDISLEQDLAWATRIGANDLKESIDSWLSKFKKKRLYILLYRKYYNNSRVARMSRTKYFGTLSKYDKLIKEESKKLNWDWRLLASLVYQESRFDPNAESTKGAFGLMQLMPNTADMYGVDINSSPETQIKAGVKYLQFIEKTFRRILDDETDLVQFTLASYNVGLGHVLDARKLAKKNGRNPDVWKDNVDYYLLNKSNPKYYKDKIVKHGYCRGKEPYNYVRKILKRYSDYKNIIRD